MLNHVAWNKREHTKLATVAHESFEVKNFLTLFGLAVEIFISCKLKRY